MAQNAKDNSDEDENAEDVIILGEEEGPERGPQQYWVENGGGAGRARIRHEWGSVSLFDWMTRQNVVLAYSFEGHDKVVVWVVVGPI